MLWHDEAGSAVTPPPPPPLFFLLLLLLPQPVATSASTATAAMSSPRNGRCLTRSSSVPRLVDRRRHCAVMGKYQPIGARFQALWQRQGYDGGRAEVAEPVDAPDSKSGGRKAVWVRVPPSAYAGEPMVSPRAPLLLVSARPALLSLSAGASPPLLRRG